MPCMSGPLTDLKRLLQACEAQGIEAALWAQEACDTGGGCGCGPKIHLVVPPAEVPRVAALMQHEWNQSLEREGTFVATGAATDGEPPCPACASTAALQDGACPDCGLQLA